jgi:prenyltransferase beta subunit
MKTGAIGGDSAYTLAYTSLGGMAFISGGNLPGRGIYSQNVEMAVRFIVERAAAQSGYIQYYSSNMYSHGFAALFLAEVYGNIPARMGLQPKVVKALKRAVHLIEKCQGAAGGWGYNPQVANSDLSITVCETNALRAARNAGVAVDKRVVERAIKCVKDGQCQDGGFVYQVYPGAGRSGGQASVGCSAGSVCVLEALGAYDDPALKLGLEYLKRFIGDGKNRGSWGFYITYYLSQAMFMAGEENWNKWWPLIKQSLLSQQQRDGSWPGSEAGPEYSSAVALIVLQMPYRYLPLYQEGIESADNRPRE